MNNIDEVQKVLDTWNASNIGMRANLEYDGDEMILRIIVDAEFTRVARRSSRRISRAHAPRAINHPNVQSLQRLLSVLNIECSMISIEDDRIRDNNISKFLLRYALRLGTQK